MSDALVTTIEKLTKALCEVEIERDRLRDALSRVEAVCAAYENTASYDGTDVNRCARDVGGIARDALTRVYS